MATLPKKSQRERLVSFAEKVHGSEAILFDHRAWKIRDCTIRRTPSITCHLPQ
ncbi:MAG: hypothetical protein NT037_12325 [Hyphomicrobiales bacterium]|nr:hypothetical protein [Hyphomicrobiales bacterium]